jgi:hypothetical protein
MSNSSEPKRVHELPYWWYMTPTPGPTARLSEAGAKEAWSWVEPWVGAVNAALPGLFEGDLQSAADFKALYGEVDNVGAVACALVSTGYNNTEDAFNARQPDSVIIEAFAEEIAAQNLRLYVDYVSVLANHLDRPEVDWLESPNVDLALDLEVGDTDASFLWFFSKAAIALELVSTPAGVLNLL